MSEEREKNAVEKKTLYLVSTPIGNMDDVSRRALKVLGEVDFIAAEDTRKTGLMLSRLGIKGNLVSYYDHNKTEKGPVIIERIKNGENCALVTDAGTPAISDPGEDLVVLAAENQIPVVSVPGACAAISALTVSGLPTGRFVFEGFLPTDPSKRKQRLAAIAAETRTVVVYEAPHKLKKTLDDLKNTLGDREISLCRELTKLNEEIIRTTVEGAVAIYKDKEPRGEYVLVIGGAKESRAQDYPEDVAEHVDLLIAGGLGRMNAIKKAAKERGVPKSVVYDAYIERRPGDGI